MDMKFQSFNPAILTAADSDDKKVIYYGLWDSCTRPPAEHLVYKSEPLKNGMRIIAEHTVNPRVHYVGTEQRTERLYKILMEEESGSSLKVAEVKFYRFRPVVQRTEKEKSLASEQENREQLLKYTSKRMQKMDSARKRRAIGVAVDDALKLKHLKVCESKIRDTETAKRADETTADSTADAQKSDSRLPDDPSLLTSDDLIASFMNQKAKTTAELFAEEAILSPDCALLLQKYSGTTTADSLSSDFFRQVFTSCKSAVDKGLAVFGDALVTISKIRGAESYADDPLSGLQEAVVKQELMRRFTDQTSAASRSSTRSKLKWIITDKQKDVITALVLILMYKLSGGKKYVPVTSATRLLSTAAKKVIRVAQLMGCRLDRNTTSGQDIYFQLPSERAESEQRGRAGRPVRKKKS